LIHTHDKRDDEDDNEAPPRHPRLSGIVGRLSHRKGSNKDKGEPPSRDGLVLEHLEVVLIGNVAVVVFTSEEHVPPSASESALDAAERDVSKSGSDSVKPKQSE
jgi:hypothetical protein